MLQDRLEVPDRPLLRDDLDDDPIRQFQMWFDEAQEAGLPQPEAIGLATADKCGRPSLRMVLLRGVDERGFVFHTNYCSRKSRELEENPHAALVVYWQPLGRQVRIEGIAARLPEAESDAYFASRPRESCISAWASPQSEVIGSREELEERVAAQLKRFGQQGPVPRPPFWGGWRIRPTCIEFWQSRKNRLHDRFRYRRSDDGWQIERLAP